MSLLACALLALVIASHAHDVWAEDIRANRPVTAEMV